MTRQAAEANQALGAKLGMLERLYLDKLFDNETVLSVQRQSFAIASAEFHVMMVTGNQNCFWSRNVRVISFQRRSSRQWMSLNTMHMKDCHNSIFSPLLDGILKENRTDENRQQKSFWSWCSVKRILLISYEVPWGHNLVPACFLSAPQDHHVASIRAASVVNADASRSASGPRICQCAATERVQASVPPIFSLFMIKLQ